MKLDERVCPTLGRNARPFRQSSTHFQVWAVGQCGMEIDGVTKNGRVTI